LEKTDTVSFNIPAFRAADGSVTCPQADKCAGVCYARQGRYLAPDAQHARETNLAVIRASVPLFTRLAIDDLHRIPNSSIRVHDSGDFFDQAYLDAWFAIMRAYEGKRFYAYTKSLHLNWAARPANFNVVQSVGGKLDHLIDTQLSHARIFATHYERRQAGYGDGSHTDRLAQQGAIKIGLVYHGNSNLTDAKRRMLRVLHT
jgi:hypothetical protein